MVMVARIVFKSNVKSISHEFLTRCTISTFCNVRYISCNVLRNILKCISV